MGLFKKKDLGKIYTTTDGYFANNSANKKKRHVLVVDQRKSDGAVAVSKLHSQKPNQKNCLKKPILSAQKHEVLTADTVVEKRVIRGVKRDGQYKAIYTRDMTETQSRLGIFEFLQVKVRVRGRNGKERATFRKTNRKWHNGFGNKKKR